jgi:glucose/arabinose dehydrogenase
VDRRWLKAHAGLALLVAVAASVWPGRSAMAQVTLGFEPVATGLRLPVGVTHAGDGSGRLFIVEQAGRILIHDGAQVLPSPFLDVSALVSCCDERGLLGLAFHPSYAVNGLFYVDYTNTAGDTVIARYRVSGDPNLADPTSAQILLTVAQPFANHNGGQLGFGPDGFLYIALGDGGDGGDPGNRAQNLGTLLGKILRIDVDGASPYAIPATNPFRTTPGARSEIWAYGLRNPWRFSFDRQMGDLFIADVGQNAREEVNFQPAASPGGENYGWRRMEGTLCFNPPSSCNDGTLTLPILEYDHLSSPRNCSITGGYRYRGGRFPQMAGRYVYGDFCSGRIWSGIQNGQAWSASELVVTGLSITSFGEDEGGELYVVHHGSGTTGTLQRVVEVSQSFLLTVDRTGAGAGTVRSAPEGIRCGSACSQTFGAGAAVTLTATPAAGSVFTGWSGGGCAGTGACTVTVTGATAVSAAFGLSSFTLTVERSGTGSGTITSADGRIGCPVTCATGYASGTTVTLAASADAGSAFTGWSGGGCSGTGPCAVTLGADTTVTAIFVQQGFTLSVATTGPGSVKSGPAGISCGTTCVAAFAPGTMVMLTAAAAAGATFAGWSGACAGTAGLCAVTMTAAQSAAATFAASFGGAFADDPLAARVTPVKAVHVTDLRLAIDRERTRRALAAFAWTDPMLVPGVTPATAIHLVEMRAALNQAYEAARLTPPTYTDPTTLAGQVPVRVAHIAELRAAVRALE